MGHNGPIGGCNQGGRTMMAKKTIGEQVRSIMGQAKAGFRSATHRRLVRGRLDGLTGKARLSGSLRDSILREFDRLAPVWR